MPTPAVSDPAAGPVVLDAPRRAEAMGRARLLAERLAAAGVTMVALSWVDNAGIARAKTVPLGRLERAAGWGIGMSPVFDVFLVNDTITTSPHIGGPGGDLRLVPDLDRLAVLAGQPGWAWAPVSRYTQEGRVYAGCQRSFARRMAAEARDRGLELRMAFEIEWALGTEASGTGGADAGFRPACSGPAYGMTRVIELSDYGREVVGALEREGLTVEQFHPEYAAGQLEISVAAARSGWRGRRQRAGPADHPRGVRATRLPGVVRAVSGRRIGRQRRARAPQRLAGRPEPAGRRPRAARPHRRGRGVRRPASSSGLPALTAVGAPSVASYLRLVPSHWAGVFQCWGRENREAALRLVTGSAGEQDARANLEVKCFDLAANPYLVTGALIAAGLAGAASGAALPPEIDGDPAGLSAAELDRPWAPPAAAVAGRGLRLP